MTIKQGLTAEETKWVRKQLTERGLSRLEAWVVRLEPVTSQRRDRQTGERVEVEQTAIVWEDHLHPVIRPQRDEDGNRTGETVEVAPEKRLGVLGRPSGGKSE